MINQLRTLLLNRSGASQPGLNYPGEELVPTAYNAKTLSFDLSMPYKVLFGIYPDRAYQNWRLRQYLPILHDTPMAEAVFDLDPRVTYLPFDDRLYTQAVAGAAITPQGATTDQLYLVQSEPSYGYRSYYSWLITVIDGTTVEVQDLSDPLYIQPPIQLTYSVASGLSHRLHLPLSPYDFYFQPTSGDSWTVSVLTAPTQNIKDVYTMAKTVLPEGSINALFGSPSVEPYLSFRNLWEKSPFPTWQLGGLILALGYRINEL